jgi:hypothetical protein
LPVLPLYLACAFEGIIRLSRYLPDKRALGVRVAFSAGLGLFLVLNVAFAYRAPHEEGPGRVAYRQLLSHVGQTTSPDSRFVLWKPRAFTLLSDRPAGFYVHTADEQAFFRDLKERAINYVIMYKREPSDWRWLAPHLRNRDRLSLTYDNPEFSMYEVQQTR